MPRSQSHNAFTLVEVLIVVIILGILAAAVVPQFTDASTESHANSTAILVRALQRKLEERRFATGTYPAAFEEEWFEGHQFPQHPLNTEDRPWMEIQSAVGVLHPTNKVLTSSVAGAFWYNPAEGVVRARVPDMGSQAATLDVYNQINVSNEGNLGNYGGGGGGGGSGGGGGGS